MKFSLFPKSIPIEYQKLISQICAVSIMIALLNGCSILTSPKENPVIEEHANNLFDMKRMGTLSTTAERREVIFKFPDNQFCAEPSPDVAESLTSSLSLMAQASVNKTGDATKDAAIDAKLQLSKELATSIRHLFQRTQGVQFFRDGLFNLCIAKMNGTITQEEYKTFYEKLVTHSVNLISEELKLRPVTPPSP